MLRADGRARAVEQALTLPIRGARWQIDPSPGDNGELAYTEQLLTETADMGGMRTPIQQVIASASSASLYRSSCFEKVYKINDGGQVVYDKIAYRPPTSCYLARSAKTAQLEGFLQWTWTDIASFERVYIPTAKSWVYIHGLHRDPIMGASDIEVCYRAFQTKQKLRWLWASYLESQVIPKALAQTNSDDLDRAAELAGKVASLRGGGTIGMVAGESVTPFEANVGNGGNTFAQAISYLDEEMYSSILASFLGLGTASGVRGGGGSYALSLSQTDFFLQSRRAVLDEMAESITHSLIAPMIRWNFGRRASVPKFKFVGMAPTENTTEAIVQMVSALVAAPTPAGGTPAVPEEFVDELVEMTAGMLGLNGPKVHDAVRTKKAAIVAADPASAAASGIHAAADVAAEALQTATNSQP
jgi:hypothetical protein